LQDHVASGWTPDLNDDVVPSPQANWFDLGLEPHFLLTKAGTPRKRIEVAKVQSEWHSLPRLRLTYHRLRRYFLPYHPDRQRRYSIWGPNNRHWVTITEGMEWEYPVRSKDNPKMIQWRKHYPDRFNHPKHWLKLLLGQVSLSAWWYRCGKAHCILVDLDFKPHWCSMSEKEKALALAPWVAACEHVDAELDTKLRPQFYASGGKGVYLCIPLDRPYPRHLLALLLHEIITMARGEGARFRHEPQTSPAVSSRPIEVYVDVANVPLVDLPGRMMEDRRSGLRLVWSRYRIEGRDDLPPVRSGWVDHQGRHVEDQIDFFLTMEDSAGVEEALETLEQHWEGLTFLHGEVQEAWREAGRQGDYDHFLIGHLHDCYEKRSTAGSSGSGSIGSVIERLYDNGNGNDNGNDPDWNRDWRKLHRWLYVRAGNLPSIPRQLPLSIVSPHPEHGPEPAPLPAVRERPHLVGPDSWRCLLPDRITQKDSYARALIDNGVQLKVCASALRSRPEIAEVQQAGDIIAEISDEISSRGDLRALDSVRSSVRGTVKALLTGARSKEAGEPLPLSSVQAQRCAEISKDLCSPKRPKGLDEARIRLIIENIARLINVREEIEIDQRSLATWSGVSQPRISATLSLVRRDCAGCRVPLLELVRAGSKGRRAARYAVLREGWGAALPPPARS